MKFSGISVKAFIGFYEQHKVENHILDNVYHPLLYHNLMDSIWEYVGSINSTQEIIIDDLNERFTK